MTTDWKYYFDSVDGKSTSAFESDENHSLKGSISFFHTLNTFDLTFFDVAIIGVCDSRNSANKSCDKAPDQIRKALYGLVEFSKNINILDLGNLKGKSINDRFVLLENVIYDLISINILPVVLGGGQDYTLPVARAVKRYKTNYRLAVIDAKVDWGSPEKDFSSSGFLGLLSSDVQSEPEDLSIVGCQKYFMSISHLAQLRNRSYDFLRLGEIKQKGIKIVEPWMRDADFISFDVNAIRQSDLPIRHESGPNGFYADEACQIAWYAGLSDQLKVFGLFELGISDEKDCVNAMVAGQILWYLIEGCSSRCKDYPVKEIEDYRQYIVHLDEYGVDMKFYNNPDNDRWWVEVPGIDSNAIIACGRTDFEEASRSEIPDKWFRFLKKN